MNVSEHRLMETVDELCAVSESLTATVNREGGFEPCLERSRKRRDVYEAKMQEYGWQTRLQGFAVKDGTGYNVLAKSRNALEPRVLFGSHSDYCAGQGVNDNITGMAVSLEIARLLRGSELADSCRFGTFDMEERGLWGSRSYVEQPPEQVPARMVNLDALGGRDLFVMQTDGNHDLVTELWQAGSDAGVPLYPIDGKQIPVSSDHVPFLKKNIPATTLIGFSPEAYAVLAEQLGSEEKYRKLMDTCTTANKPTDLRQNLDPANMVATVRLLIQWLANHA
ncbi:MAG TPA: M28 family peptidase [Candidatus Peribacteria bacterium]|nr:M28 family peptidase [Candidatus Peribacteria bacterium]